MSNMKNIATVATTLLFCLGTSSAFANTNNHGYDKQHNNQHHREMQREAMQKLNLTDSQKETIKLMRRQANRLADAQNKHAVFAVLTPEQQATMLANQATRQAEHRPMKRGAERLEKLLKMADKVAATEEQKSQLTAIHSESSAQMQSYQASMMAHKMAERGLIQSAEFDIDAWQALQDDFAPTVNKIDALREKVQADIKTVFTPEQQKKLRKMKQRKGKSMQGHSKSQRKDKKSRD